MKKLITKISKILNSMPFFHVASSLVLVLSLVMTFTTHRVSVYRLINAVKVFGIGIWYYIRIGFLGTLDFDAPLPELPSIEFYKLLEYMNLDVDKLVYKIENVIPGMFDLDNFFSYTYYFIYVSLLVFCFAMMAFTIFYAAKEVICSLLEEFSDNHKDDTKALRFFKKRVESPALSVFYYVVDFFRYFFKLKRYKLPFIIIWLLNLNIYSLVLEAVTRLLVWSISSKFSFAIESVGVFLLDAIIAFISAPLFWLALAAVIFYKVRDILGFDKLDHLYRQDMGALKSCGYNIIYEGETGSSKSKNAVMTARMFDDLYHTEQWESMHECHLEYPDFPFYDLQEEIFQNMQEHLIFNLHTAREFASYKMAVWLKTRSPEDIYGYTGRMYYNDGCRYVPIWEMINDYSQLYFMFTNDTSAISANISIRTNIKQVPGYMPLWDNAMTKRKPELYEEYTRYCHILNYDAVRFGTTVEPNSEYVGASDYGVNLYDELDKDRGNQETNKIYDASSDEANTLNDGFDAYLMFERHLALVRFKCYVRNLAALQRDDNFKAREKSLFDRILIAEKSDTKFAIPLFFEYGIYKLIDKRFSKFEQKLMHYGQIHTLPYYFLQRILSPFINYCRRKVFQFGYDVHIMQRIKACNENNVVAYKFYTLYCIAHDGAYASDCYNLISDEIAKNVNIGIADFPTYEGKYPQAYEFAKQHSYFAKRQLERIAKSKARRFKSK